MLRILRNFRLGIIVLLPVGSPVAQNELLVGDPVLLDELYRHEDRLYPVGVPFPDEDLTCLYFENAVVDHVVRDSSGDPRIVFTSVPTNSASYKLFPNIVHMASAGHWVRTPIPITGDGWTHVHVSEDGRNFLLLMDNVQESAGWETRFVISNDGGETWRYGDSVRKYVYFDVIRYLKMSETGIGTAIEHYEGDIGGYDDIGYYIFETTDWGMTWSDRRFSEEFDTSDYVDVIAGYRQRRLSEQPLSQLSLPGFRSCSGPE